MTTRSRISGGLAAALLATLLTGGPGCRSPETSRAAPEPTQEVPHLIRQADGRAFLIITPQEVPGITFSKVAQVGLPAELEAPGRVTFDERRMATIVSRVAGRIEATQVSRWDNVKRGERILALYSPDFMTAEAEYLQALDTAKLSLGRATGGAGNEASAIVSAAKRKLELLGMEGVDIHGLRQPAPTVWMRAPIDGTVLENKALRGAQVNSGDVLYALGTLDDVWIIADIYEDDLARIHPGEKLTAVVTAFPNRSFEGIVSRVSPNINPDTHTAGIRCEIRNLRHELKPEMLARVRIVTEPGRALVVPQEALVFDTDSYFAFVDVGGGRLERRSVTIGSWNESGYARVVSGLSEGQSVVTRESIQVDALWHQAQGGA